MCWSVRVCMYVCVRARQVVCFYVRKERVRESVCVCVVVRENDRNVRQNLRE